MQIELTLENAILGEQVQETEEMKFDFSTWNKGYETLSKEGKKMAEHLYEVNIRCSDIEYIDSVIKFYKPSILTPIKTLKYFFDEKTQARLIAAKVAKYDLDNGIYKQTSAETKKPITSLEKRLDKTIFQQNNNYK
jgi:hypothetical protein